MRKLTGFTLFALLLFTLAACGGGGGGGGGGGIIPTPDNNSGITPIPDPDNNGGTGADGQTDNLVSFKEKIASSYYIGGATYADFYVERTSDGIVVHDTSYMALGAKETFAEKDFVTKEGFKSAEVKTETLTHRVYLGGKELGLKYSEFGIWQAVSSTVGSYMGREFFVGDVVHIAIPEESATFTGTAVARYREFGVQDNIHMGTAKMYFDAHSSDGWTLNMYFPNAFTITSTHIQVDELSGWMQEPTGKYTTIATTGIYPESIINNRSITLLGKFYGPNILGAATEGVGTWQTSTSSASIVGAFGVVRDDKP